MAKEDLIRCGGHGFAPWHIVCVHLVEGTSKDWVAIPLRPDDGREVDSDWLCPDCADEYDAGINIDKLKPVCMHCVRKLRGVE